MKLLKNFIDISENFCRRNGDKILGKLTEIMENSGEMLLIQIYSTKTLLIFKMNYWKNFEKVFHRNFTDLNFW